jgi:hypothetical protein
MARSFASAGWFPECLEEVEVNLYDAVEPMDFRQAMSLYWNVDNLKANGLATSGFLVSGFQVEAEEDEPTRLSNTYTDPDPAEPEDRVCGIPASLDELFVNQSGTQEPDGSNYATVDIECNLEIVSLLRNGVSIGYGVRPKSIRSTAYSNAADIDEAIRGEWWVNYGDFQIPGWSVDFLPENNIPQEDITEEVEITEIDGIPFIRLKAWGDTIGGLEPDPAANVVSANAEIESFNFYSY